MNIKPLADRVLILPAPAEEKTQREQSLLWNQTEHGFYKPDLPILLRTDYPQDAGKICTASVSYTHLQWAVLPKFRASILWRI